MCWSLRVREPKRTDDQNAALGWGLRLNQIQRQTARPSGNWREDGRPMLWKATFMDALGMEVTLLPKLDGDGYFPTGRSLPPR